MLNEDELGELLRKELHAIGESIEPQPGFWERVVPEPWPMQRRFTIKLLVPAAAALAAAVAAAVLALGSVSTPNAFAVAVRGNSITISLEQVSAVEGLNQELERLNLPFRAVPITATCTTRLDLTYINTDDGPEGLQLTRAGIPAGSTVIIAAEQQGADKVIFAIGRTDGPVPTCASSKDFDSSLPGVAPHSTTASLPPAAKHG